MHKVFLFTALSAPVEFNCNLTSVRNMEPYLSPPFREPGFLVQASYYSVRSRTERKK